MLGVLSALRFETGKDMSQYELTRLSNQGDKAARELLMRTRRLPELESLRLIIITIFSTALVTSSVFAFGLAGGVSTGALLLISHHFWYAYRSCGPWQTNSVTGYGHTP